MSATNTPPLPPGFVLEAPAPSQGMGQQTPALPPGFVLDEPAPVAGAYEDALADASARSQFFQGGPDPRSRYNVALRNVRENLYPDMPDEEWNHYSQSVFAPDVRSQADQSQTFGFSDEIGGALAGLGSQVRQWTGGGGPGYGEASALTEELQRARLELARKQNGGLGTAAEIVSGAAMMGPVRSAAGALPALAPATLPAAAQGGSRMVQAARAAVPLAAEGGLYGFGSTDGNLGDRMRGAGVGAGLSVAGGAGANLAGKVIQGTARRVVGAGINRANAQTIKQAVKSAPTAASIKAASQAGYRAAEATGAVIDQKAVDILAQQADQLARGAGLIMPNGAVSNAFPKAAHALDAIRQYAGGHLPIKDAQVLLRHIRVAQKSADPTEAGIGNSMAELFDDFMDALPTKAFTQGDGRAAIQNWAKGKSDWARSKRTQALEDIIYDAGIKGGSYAANLRTGFRSMLLSKNAKKRRGFSQADLQAIERFVQGGPIEELLERIGSGAGLPGGVMGGVTGGPIGAVAVPAAGMLARVTANRNARQGAQQLRAQVATPGGIPLLPQPPRASLPAPAGLRMLGGLAANRLGG